MQEGTEVAGVGAQMQFDTLKTFRSVKVLYSYRSILGTETVSLKPR
jgi:hypothetical protein